MGDGNVGATNIGQTFRYVREPIELMQETARYGDLATMSVKSWLIYLLNRPDLVEQVLVTSHMRVGRWRRYAHDRPAGAG